MSGLPLPAGIYNWYQGLLPTWLYPFQFPVNTDPPVTVSLVGPWPLILFGAVMLAAAFAAYSAWVWRVTLAERAAEAAGDDDDGPLRARRRPDGRPGPAGRPAPVWRQPGAPRALGPRPGPWGPGALRLASLPGVSPGRPARGSGGTSARKCGGRAPWAARRRMTNP